MNDHTPTPDRIAREAHSIHEFISWGLAACDGHLQQARITFGFSSLWAITRPEVRRYVLLLVAWEARSATVDLAEAPSITGPYARDFIQSAAEWTRQNPGDTVELFCTSQHSAYNVASSLAFDRDDHAVSLQTVLLLAALAPKSEAQ
ncbi:hypothetical protein GCM10022403_080340 [Streptomyces coacervatus]|uniref:Uncharacterized protein n=1 Tax=Streptomyces coacervatus TaxID=647381 RepID=A0ABP7J5R6_9ACTN|nr:hypothetical protein [Streptomyces coacervatus]MDF2269412.1 hypothetical protein [Streptomyces coacervatus]